MRHGSHSQDVVVMTPNHSSTRAGPASRDVPLGSGEVVLIVEDDPSLGRMIAAQLQSLGYSVVKAQDADAAFKALESEREIDLLLTDIVLSEGLNGVELGQAARELRPALQLMYMSAYPAAAQDAGTPLEADVMLLRKPFRRIEIANAVRNALHPT